MGGWATYSALKADIQKGLVVHLPYGKGGATPLAALTPHSHWRGGFNPPAGSFPTAGLGSAVAVSRADAGAMALPHVSAVGEDLYLAYFSSTRVNGAWTTNDIETIYLLDRLAHVSIAINQATGAISPSLDGTARLAAAEGAMMIAEVHTALSAASNVFTLTYTNSAGATGKVTPQITTVASAIVDRVAYANWYFIPFADGDDGARIVTNWTLVSGTATGTITIALVKPIAVMGAIFRGAVYERDFVTQLAWLPRIHKDAALFLMHAQTFTGNDARFGSIGVISK